jgi:hypothetical protein
MEIRIRRLTPPAVISNAFPGKLAARFKLSRGHAERLLMDQSNPADLNFRPEPLIARLIPNYFRDGRVLAAAALGAAAATILVAGALAFWYSYSVWCLGRVELTTDGPPLKVQILAESGDEPVSEPFDLVDHTMLSLPAGDYRLRVIGTGSLVEPLRSLCIKANY